MHTCPTCGLSAPPEGMNEMSDREIIMHTLRLQNQTVGFLRGIADDLAAIRQVPVVKMFLAKVGRG